MALSVSETVPVATIRGRYYERQSSLLHFHADRSWEQQRAVSLFISTPDDGGRASIRNVTYKLHFHNLIARERLIMVYLEPMSVIYLSFNYRMTGEK
jgi:hypothetical protein